MSLARFEPATPATACSLALYHALVPIEKDRVRTPNTAVDMGAGVVYRGGLQLDCCLDGS